VVGKKVEDYADGGGVGVDFDKAIRKKAKEIAKQRFKFMKQFFKRLKREINGEL